VSAAGPSVLTMEQRLSLITLGVPDLDEARRFYLDGLGWTPVLDVAGQVTFVQVAPGVLLSLFDAAELAADIGDGRPAAPAVGNVTLAHNVGSEAEVDAVLADAVRAGATLVKPAQRAAWGGYHGYFADPAGTPWEVAFNPGLVVDDDGAVRMAG
jgi:catechol 2,3-dioxygenase-like lactoylglutathione lyase family enzyme